MAWKTARPTIAQTDGQVTTRYAATVMDTGRPELCLGPVAESYPPQCGGPALEGWDWAAYDGHYDQQGDIRWGVFYVTGTWDGSTFVVSSAEPATGRHPRGARAAASARRPAVDRRARPDRGRGPRPRRRDRLLRQRGPGAVDVPYDDGSLQAWVDEEYGAGVVAVAALATPEIALTRQKIF